MNRFIMIKAGIVLLAIAGTVDAQPLAAQEQKKSIWQDILHLGDNPEKYPKITSAGMTFQVPCKLDTSKAANLTITATEVQTQAGHGHYVEVIAHFENQPNKAPAKEIVVETFRIKDKTTEDKSYTFEINPGKGLRGAEPAYHSVRIKLDTFVPFTLWDDILIKRIEVEQ